MVAAFYYGSSPKFYGFSRLAIKHFNHAVKIHSARLLLYEKHSFFIQVYMYRQGCGPLKMLHHQNNRSFAPRIIRNFAGQYGPVIIFRIKRTFFRCTAFLCDVCYSFWNFLRWVWLVWRTQIFAPNF